MTTAEQQNRFPFLQQFAEEMQIPADNLIQVFEVERTFHHRILETDDPAARQALYADLYATVHPLLRQRSDLSPSIFYAARAREARCLVLLFRKELVGRSVLDVGCGDGHFLLGIHELLPHGDLCGLDTSNVGLPHESAYPGNPIRFVRQDISSFTLSRNFDVVFSNQVLEHLAPSDLPVHLRSICNTLTPGGRFIVSLPNRHWGPSDITRIIDNTYMGRVPAQGSHLNESSYGELIPLLRNCGFSDIKTVIPFAHVLPFLRSVRIRPWMNQLLEWSTTLRTITHFIKRRNRPLFTNPVILICQQRRDLRTTEAADEA